VRLRASIPQPRFAGLPLAGGELEMSEDLGLQGYRVSGLTGFQDFRVTGFQGYRPNYLVPDYLIPNTYYLTPDYLIPIT
jgi:hypothetical protein